MRTAASTPAPPAKSLVSGSWTGCGASAAVEAAPASTARPQCRHSRYPIPDSSSAGCRESRYLFRYLNIRRFGTNGRVGLAPGPGGQRGGFGPGSLAWFPVGEKLAGCRAGSVLTANPAWPKLPLPGCDTIRHSAFSSWDGAPGRPQCRPYGWRRLRFQSCRWSWHRLPRCKRWT